MPVLVAFACFNSMIVRLKGLCWGPAISAYNSFQFYDSPIKSAHTREEATLFFEFQFYDSPIKRSEGYCGEVDKNAFQFYDSPIKSDA